MKTFVLLLITGLLLLSGAPAAAQTGPDDSRLTALQQDLDDLAAELSSLLMADNTLGVMTDSLLMSKTLTLPLADTLATAATQASDDDTGAVFFRLAAHVRTLEATLADLGAPVPRLDLMLPASTSPDLLASSEAVYVAAAPLSDETATEMLAAYTQGERMAMSLDEPPASPTLIIAVAETESLDPVYPLLTADEEPEEAEPERIVDDFVGIVHILITDDHEPWYRGNPEIYVTFRAFLNNGVWRDNRIDLPGVNDEDVLYRLGDPNSTYLYFDNRFDPYIEVVVRESDWPDPDAVLGVFIINWQALPFGGYQRFTNGDARLSFDRD